MEKQEPLLEQKVLNEKEVKIKYKQYHPFLLAKKNDEVFILIGNNVLSAIQFKSFKSAIEYIESKPYELIINTCVLINQHLNTNNNE